jgi:L-fuconolactonase
MRLDAHQHFWRYEPAQYPWITDSMAILRRAYLPNDLTQLLSSIGFDGSIAVQARQTVTETEWLLGLADAHSIIKGVVGWVDLRSPNLRQELHRFRSHPKLVGVRHVVQDEPDDEFMLRPDFRRGLGQLREFGLTYDLLLFPKHLAVAAKVVAEFPDQPFVLDHIAKPPIRQGQISPWRDDLRRLAQFPNVFCKLSGMITEADWTHWRPSDFRPYLDTVTECFGANRLMIGSDWPVCRVAGEYEAAMQIVLEYVGQFPADVQAGILGGNCARFYLARIGARA